MASQRLANLNRQAFTRVLIQDAQHLERTTIGQAIVLTMMRFADELADLGDFKFPAAQGIRPPELKMAMQLIDSLAAKWEPAKYTDEYKDNLMKVIQGKLKGRRPKLQERETKQPADVVDLMTRLRASL